MNEKQIVDEKLDKIRFWSRFFKLTESDSQQQPCPFHDDDDPSLTLNIKEGKWFCHACNEGGDKYAFWMKKHDVDFKQALNDIADEFGIELKGRQAKNLKSKGSLLSQVNEHHKTLLGQEDLLKKLNDRGITNDTALHFKLGWSKRDRRIWIPIFVNGKLEALRRWDLLKVHKSNMKFTSFKTWNDVTLWPTDVIKKFETVWLLGGEPDTLTAFSIGIPAVTFTNGEGKFSDKYAPYFKGKNVYICFDVDEAGQKGAKKIALKLQDIAKSVYFINLPKDKLPTKGDFTDYAKLLEFDKKKIHLLTKNAKRHEAPEEEQESLPLDIDGELSIELSEASLAKYNEAKVNVKGILAGRATNSFFAPKKIVANCDMSYGDICNECPMFSSAGVKERNIYQTGDILKLIDIDDKSKKREMKSMIKGVPLKCPRISFSEKEISNVDFIQLIPEVDLDAEETFKFKTAGVYTANLNHLEDNQVYKVSGKVIADPRTQRAIILADKAILTDKSFSKYEPKESAIKKLKEMTAGPNKDINTIEEFFNQRTMDLMTNVCGLVGRADLIKVYDIVWHSVRSFKFQNRKVTKGWCEALILGDTRTGKSSASESFIKHFRSGKYINCEGATLAGLIGGQNAYGSRLIFTWGVIPMQDGRLVVLDESQDLHTDIIGSLSAIRSRGVASRPIVGGERSSKSQVRLIWLANPRSNRNIKEFHSGVDAIRELIGKEEDIARFDMVLLISKDEIDQDRYFKDFPEVEHIWDGEVASTLVSWAWSRKSQHILISQETEQHILKCSQELSQKFGKSIPTVQPAEMRIRLAKLAISVAILSFSTEDGESVKVDPQHAEYAMLILYQLYTKKSFGASLYEARYKTRTHEQIDKKQVINRILPYGLNAINFLLRNSSFNKQDFYLITHGVSGNAKEEADVLVKDLVMKYNCLYKGKSNAFIKDKQFTEWLIELKEQIESGELVVPKHMFEDDDDPEPNDEDVIEELFE